MQTVEAKEPIFTLTIADKPKVVEWVNLGEIMAQALTLPMNMFAND